MKNLTVFATFLCLASAAANDLKEPSYESQPKYSLITFGKDAAVKVWIVEDGKRLFVDRNANGDLTDDGPPLEPQDFSSSGSDNWSFKYLLGAIAPEGGPQHTDFVLRRWNYGDEADKYGLSVLVNGHTLMYAGWFGTFWSSRPETVPVTHFGGPFDPSMMRRKAFEIGETGKRLSLGFFRKTSELGTWSRLGFEAVPQDVVPELQIEWPTETGNPPVKSTHSLENRCCYWEFYTTKFTVPDGVVPGTAMISVVIPPDAVPDGLTTTKIEYPVIEKASDTTQTP